MRYCRSCRERVQQLGRFLILKRDDFRCAYCGKQALEDGAGLHLDHVVPRIAGGRDIASNLITSCAECNLSKHAELLTPRQTARYLAEIQRRNEQSGISNETGIRENGSERESEEVADAQVQAG